MTVKIYHFVIQHIVMRQALSFHIHYLSNLLHIFLWDTLVLLVIIIVRKVRQHQISIIYMYLMKCLLESDNFTDTERTKMTRLLRFPRKIFKSFIHFMLIF